MREKRADTSSQHGRTQGISGELSDTSRSRILRWLAWFLLVGYPVYASVLVLLMARHDHVINYWIRRQFVNCYVALPAFFVILALVYFLFVVSARLAANPIAAVASNPIRVMWYIVLLALAGVFLLRTSFLSHAWYDWSLLQRVLVSLTNLSIVVGVGGAFLLLFPVWGKAKPGAKGKAVLLVALLLWGYVLASLYRMMPFVVAYE